MYGCGSRIWTYDLRVMSPTSYQTALSRVIGAEDRNRTDTVFYHRRILSPVRLPVPPPRHLAPRVGLEPTAYRLTAECSTIELPRNITTLMSGVRFLKFDYFFIVLLSFFSICVFAQKPKMKNVDKLEVGMERFQLSLQDTYIIV